MKEALKQKMLDGISKEPNLRDQMIAEKCAQIALEFFGATSPELRLPNVVESPCKHPREFHRGGEEVTFCGLCNEVVY